MPEPSKPLTIQDCYDIVASEVFRFRPPSYCKDFPKWPGQVGIEVEMLPLQRSNETGAMVPLYEGEQSLAKSLIALAKEQGWTPEFAGSEEPEHLQRIKLDTDDQLTFEPGGQLEFSSKPYPCLSDAHKRVRHVQGLLRRHFRDTPIKLYQSGINPFQTTEEIGLQMGKPRYQAMNRYFGKIGAFGAQMMRQTTTLQVNLDFGADEQTLAKRYLLSNYLAPIATAIFANSPVRDRFVTTMQSTRGEAWRHLDPSRTGVPNLDEVAAKLSKQACVDAYMDSLLKAPVIFVEADGFSYPEGITLEGWLESPWRGFVCDRKAFDTHMGLHFPEVRPRGFLELRSVDCQGRAWQEVPGAFYTALLYVDEVLEKALEALKCDQVHLERRLRASSFGLKNDELASLAKLVMELALSGFSRLPPCFQGDGLEKSFQAFADHFTLRRRSPADDLRKLIFEGHEGKILPIIFDQLDELWFGLIE